MEKSKKILIIEDDENTCATLRDILVEKGFPETTFVYTAEDGLTRVQANRPDLIILDICLPKMDGYTFLQELREIEGGADIPIIVLTGKEQMKDLFALEVKEYIVKPCDQDDLVKKINTILNI